MDLRRKEFGDVGDVAYGLSQLASPDGTSVVSDLCIVPGQFVYMQLPAVTLRNFCDGLAPGLAKNPIADCAQGFSHRYVAGHDLLLDVPTTFLNHGTHQGLKQAGHIIVTDFPTRAGIPIPGFSHSGLGHILEEAGIARGWLQVSLFDSGVGVFVFSDGATNLIQAFQGALSMDFSTGCQTFGVGMVDILFAMQYQNPIVLAGGVQNILAGLVSTWQTFSVYVDPLDFFGASVTSALLGFAVTHGLVGASPTEATLTAVRSGTVGALFTVSTAFGFGAIAGFMACQLGKALAENHNRAVGDRLTVKKHSFDLLVNELILGNPQIRDLLEQAAPKWILSETTAMLQIDPVTLASNGKELRTTPFTLESRAHVLHDTCSDLKTTFVTLADDPIELLSIYKKARPMKC